ncbi:MAG: sigma-70 family RNA polymerase sigma factor [Actinomycetota bacterium]|nr:sigma-70 family RNA polymerase sigma factor [Actinomycetota bacterium]
MEQGDAGLMARITAGDDEALAEVFDRYAPLVYGLARRVTGNEATAEDVVQEVFTSLWHHPDRFDPERGSVRAFLGVQAHRRAVDAIRRETRRTAREGRQQDLAGPAESVDDGTDAKELLDVVRRAIERLPVEQRQAVELAYFGGCTQRELAMVLQIPEGTAKSRLRLAHAKLGQWLAPDILVTT